MIELKVFVFLFGALIGSFLNVVVYRIPRKLSVVKPRSKCPQCESQIKWYQNIPILSWLLLKGQCAECGAKISVRYPLTELACGLIALNLLPYDLASENLFQFIYFFSVACILLAHLQIDIEHQILPDKINLYFLLITLPYVALTSNLYFWLLGGVLGFLAPFLVTWAFYKLRGQIGLGGGDIKLFGILGLLLGPVGIMHNIFMSCLLGSVFAVVLIATKKMSKDTPLAFGPYIIVIAALQIFYPSIFEMINPFSF